jgi:hypothetical protein
VRKLVLIGLAQALLVLAGCGGGSGSGVVIAPGNNNGNGNGNGNGGGTTANTVTMTVDSGPDPTAAYDVDTPFITITVCAPGSTTNCQTINHIEVDSGSYGLRLVSSVLNSSLASALQQEKAAGGSSVVECTEFADGFSWGPVKVADVQIGGESASNVPMQVLGDPAYAQSSTTGSTTTSEIPTACSSTGPEEDTVDTFGANGIMGIGVFGDDCGPGCDTSVSGNENPGFYYQCPASGWSPTNGCSEIAIAEASQVTDPVSFFQTDNNGVIVELPSATEGASTATGTLVFGIGTQGNNTLTASTVLTADSSYGDVSATYTTHSGQQQFLPYSYFDTGSNAYYFADDSIPSGQSCSSQPGFNNKNPDSWFCPSTEYSLSATATGQNDTQATVSFSIGNAYTLFNSSSGTVFNDLGASMGAQSTDCATMSAAGQDQSCSFDFGFPFFLGRNVYIAFAGANTSGGPGPYFAF